VAEEKKLKKESQATEARLPMTPTVTIYQNPDYVSGILQQLYRQPLVTGDTVEEGGSKEQSVTQNVEGSGSIKGSVGWFGSGAEVAGKLAAAAGNAAKDATSGKRTSIWEYTQAYYLHIVRESLRGFGLLKPVNNLSEASALRVGDFVEYSAEFLPDQMAVFLDVLTPELVSAIVRHQVKQKALLAFDDWGNFDAREAYFERTNVRVQIQTELAEAVTRAVRTDFRSEETKEFFGELGEAEEAVTAITMCDRSHFTVEDTDRILDGRFTVLGKVTDTVDIDRPTLERNKLLSSIPAESIDSLMGQMKQQLDSGIEKAHLNGGVAFDPRISARVEGASFKVVPVAIYV